MTKLVSPPSARALLVAPVLALAAILPAGADEWGTLKGRFVLEGDQPEAKPLTIDKDVQVCGNHNLVAEELVIGADKGVAHVFVFAKDDDVKGDPQAGAGDQPLKLDNKNCRFEPHAIVVPAGRELTIVNSDQVAHNVNMTPIKNSPFNQIMAPGQELKVKFGKGEGRPFSAVCNIHPWMKGWVLVSPTPFAAASRPDGSFEISGLPAGEVEFVLQHEKGYLREVATKLGKTDKKGRLKIAIKPGENDLGEILITPTTFK